MEGDSVDQRRTLVVVPCGSSKIWKSDPNHGLVSAAETYTGTLFNLNRQYAERFGDDWMILSAKYGFISPQFVIPETYEVTFNRKITNPIAHEHLRRPVFAIHQNVATDISATHLDEHRYGNSPRRFPSADESSVLSSDKNQ